MDRGKLENLKDVTIEEAQELARRYAKPVTETEFVSVSAAFGRILAEDICAEHDSPPFARSRMDGYAVRAEDISGASADIPAELAVIGEASAGHGFLSFADAGQAVRIMTGAPIPEGTDCVVKQEDTLRIFEGPADQKGRYAQENETVRICRAMKAGEHITPAGSDYKKGQKIFCSGEKLNFLDIGGIAGLGRMQVKVWRRPRVAIISTGDELAMPGTPLTNGKIYSNNLFMLQAGAADCGADVTYLQQAGDSPEMIAACLQTASEAADLTVTTGGVSVGKKDYLPEALQLCGAEMIFDGMRMRPGAPAKFSLINGRPVLNLTGTPSGAAACFHLLARVILGVLGRDDSVEYRAETAVFRGDFRKKSPKARMIRGILYEGQVYYAETISSGGYGPSLRAVKEEGSAYLQGRHCYIVIPEGSEGLQDGEEVQVMRI